MNSLGFLPGPSLSPLRVWIWVSTCVFLRNTETEDQWSLGNLDPFSRAPEGQVREQENSKESTRPLEVIASTLHGETIQGGRASERESRPGAA